jgi:hypothetical protein
MSRTCIDFALGSLHFGTSELCLHDYSSFTVRYSTATDCTYTIALLGGLGFGVKEPELPVFASQILLTDPGSYLYAGTELLYFQGGPQT